MKQDMFKYKEITIRTVNKGDEVLFNVSDIGKALDLTNVYRTVKKICKGSHAVTIPTNGGDQEMVYIDEPDLYRLLFKSKKKEAIVFQDWIFEEVLPKIRKTGEYKISKELRDISKSHRKLMTDAWKNAGVVKGYEYAHLTKQEYKSLGFQKGIKKDQLSKREILILSALESMEALKLDIDDKKGYYECRDSIKDTAKIVNKSIENKGKGLIK